MKSENKLTAEEAAKRIEQENTLLPMYSLRAVPGNSGNVIEVSVLSEDGGEYFYRKYSKKSWDTNERIFGLIQSLNNHSTLSK